MIRLPTTAPKVLFVYDVRRDRAGARRAMERWRFKGGRVLDLKDCLDGSLLRTTTARIVQGRIDAFLRQSVVTVVIIGTQANTSEDIKFTIRRTHQLEKGMLGIYTQPVGQNDAKIARKGMNPFERFWITREGHRINLAEIYPMFDWIADGGRFNLIEWIQDAAPDAFR